MNTGTKKILRISAIAFICAFYGYTALATDHKGKDHELLMLEKAKNVEYVSQKITKAYFYKQQGVRSDHAENDMKEGLSSLRKDIGILQEGIQGDKEEENIALFIAYTQDELLSTLSKPYNKGNGALILDYSESLLEGANFLAQKHLHKQDAEGAMLTTTKQILFLLERINKYYIAHKAGFKDYNNVLQLKQAVKDIETEIAAINAYKKYSESAQTSVKKFNEFWPVAKEFYIDVQKGALPVIVLASTDKLEREIRVIESYHHKANSGR